MKISDPFCRVEKRRSGRYQAVRDAMVANGVDTPQAASEVLDKLLRNGLIGAVSVALISGVLALLFPAMAGVVLVLAALALIWITTLTLTSRSQVKRYIAEELPPAE